MVKSQIKKVIVSCFMAGCLEMYDFVLFGFLASIIHKNYLGFLDTNNALIVTYALFAVGFVCRPIGAIIFGHIGDKYGRKIALVISVSLMGTASLAMSILPSYEQIGLLACYLIVLIRVIQGISVGGEYSGAAIYAIEHISKARRGLVGSGVLAGTTLGVLLATLVSNIVKSSTVPEYSWRFAFLLGFCLSLIGYFIRYKLSETPDFIKENITNAQIKNPLLQGLKFFPRQFLAGIFLSGANNANYYFALVFVPSYLSTEATQVIDFNNWFLAFFMLLLEPIFGFVSDKIGRRQMLLCVFSILTIYNVCFLDLLLLSKNVYFVLIIVICTAILISVSVSAVNIKVLEIFPVQYRYSCGALSYSLGAAIFGGTTPLMCTLIKSYIGNEPVYFGAYISCISFLGFIAAKFARKKNMIYECRANEALCY
jgi:MHS family proline/betaine transporter-like MFS transporter